jgi:L-threonylcarbamoyladenylate synthase
MMENKKEIIKLIKKGKIFIYPTDTIYGLGCNAYKKSSVKRIKKIKKREKDKPLSIIAPSKKWILKNLKVKEEFLNKYLPGKYTLILKKKNSKFLEYVSKKNTLGIRIPDNKFTKLIEEAEVPFITTSVNISKRKPIIDLREISDEILRKVDVIINSGKLSGRPSDLIFGDRIIKRE